MQQIPQITRNLLIINILCFFLQFVLERSGIDLAGLMGLHFLLAEDFRLFQFVSYMFLHGSFTHLFFNMFSLWMFGGLIERTLGARRFLLYYFVCGIGAGFCQELWQGGEYLLYGQEMLLGSLSGLPDPASPVYEGFIRQFVESDRYYELMGEMLNQWTTIGASGACYGILLAFGMLYPNERIMLLIPPIPMKAKYFVAGYAAIEVFAAWSLE